MSVAPKISVIIPVYNTAEYLKEAVGSICNQTCKSLQIIVVDDGSTDSSPEILRQLAKEDSRIEIITRKNSGQGAARNKGLERAVGEYVYFMDSDDILEPDCLEHCLELCTSDDLDYVTFDAVSFDEQGETDSNFKYQRSGLIREDLIWDSRELLRHSLENDTFKSSSCIFLSKRKLLEDNHIRFPEGIIHEDNYFVLKLMLCADKCRYLAREYFRRRVRPGSTMTNSFSIRNIKGYVRVSQEVKSMEKSFPQFKDLIELFLHKTLNSVVWLSHRLSPTDKLITLGLFIKNGLVKYASMRNWCVFLVKSNKMI